MTGTSEAPRQDRRPRFRRQALARLLLWLSACIVFAFAAQMTHGRWDMTDGKIHTLSASTRAVLADLHDPIMIRAYVTRDLPQPYGRLRRFIANELRAYHEAGHGQVAYRMVDPDADRNTAAALAALRIPRIQVQAVENDKAQIRQGYLAVVVEYLDKKAVIPVVQGEQGFEYLLTSKIKALTGKGKIKLGVVSGFGATPLSALHGFSRLVGNDYDLVDVPLEGPDAAIPDDVQVLLVDGFTRPPSDRARSLLERYRRSGRGLLVLTGNAKPDLATGFAVRPVKPATHAWLRALGVSVEPGLVLDTRASRISINMPDGRSYVDYPFIPKIQDLNRSNPVTRGLSVVSLPFASPLAWVGSAAGTHRQVLLQSSDQSALQAGPPFDINPLVPLVKRFTGVTFVRSKLALAVGAKHGASDSRLIVVGSPGMLDDELFNGDAASLALNMIDWLAHDDALIALRSRGVTLHPLIEVGATERAVWKGLWMFGLPLAVGFAGLMRWLFLRRRQRAGMGGASA